MVKEYSIPPPEGPFSQEPSRLRIFGPNEVPIDVGSLEREAFSYVGNWMTMLDGQGYGIVYRLCTKEDFKDDEGDPNILVLHFAMPAVRRGKKMPDEIAIQKLEQLKKVVQMFTIHAKQTYGDNILSIALEPPEWMRSELEEILK